MSTSMDSLARRALDVRLVLGDAPRVAIDGNRRTKMKVWIMGLSAGLAAGLATGCGKAAGPCGEAECKAYCAAAGAGAKGAPPSPAPAPTAGGMSAFEQGLVSPLLEDVRQGIRPWTDQSVGICKGEGKECDEWVGARADALPPGKYILRAELRVPRAGAEGTWKVKLDTSCDTIRKTKSGENKNTQANSKEYDVKYLGEERGYRLSPLFAIESPSKGGARSCTWKLTLAHPDGDKTLEGAWSTPDADPPPQ